MSAVASNTNTPPSAENSATSQSLAKLSDNFGSFLKLLTTQLQNQDPLSPMETSEFTNQLVMFAEAEQAIATNKKLDTLIDIGQKNEASQALGYHGKEVRVTGNKLSFSGDPVRFQYDVPAGLASGDIIVRDEKGKVVFEKKLTAQQFAEGTHVLAWDGRNQFGYQLADGLYTVAVSGKDGKGNPVNATDLSVTATVKGVEYKDGKTWLDVGHYQVTLDNVSSITTPGFKVEDQVRAMNFVGHHVHITGATAPVKNGKVSLTYNTGSVANFHDALTAVDASGNLAQTIDHVSLKFYDATGSLRRTEDITASMDATKLLRGEKRLDSVFPDLGDNNYRVEMSVKFKNSAGEEGSVFNKIPMGYSGKVRRVVFNNGEIRLEINNVLYNPNDISSVVSSETPVYKIS